MAPFGPFLSELRRIEQEADQDRMLEAIREPTLFLSEETLVFLVDMVVALEEQALGLVLERRSRVEQIWHPEGSPRTYDRLKRRIRASAALALHTLQAGSNSFP